MADIHVPEPVPPGRRQPDVPGVPGRAAGHVVAGVPSRRRVRPPELACRDAFHPAASGHRMMATTGRRRLAAVALGAATVLAGLVVRFALPRGTGSDIAGDALYAVVVYLAVAFLRPQLRPSAVATLAGSFCVAIEPDLGHD